MVWFYLMKTFSTPHFLLLGLHISSKFFFWIIINIKFIRLCKSSARALGKEVFPSELPIIKTLNHRDLETKVIREE